MRSILIIGLFTLCLVLAQSSCSSPKTTDSGDTATVPSKTDNHVIDPDVGIVPQNQADTVGLDEYGKDSLHMSIAFQLAANELSRSFKNHDLVAYCKFTSPTLVKMYGGMEKYRARVKQSFDSDSVVFKKILSGPVKRVQAAIDNEGYEYGWYCLMPVRRIRVENGNEIVEEQWLGGQSLDKGKTIYFLDITGKTRDQILKVMPDLRFVLDQEVNP